MEQLYGADGWPVGHITHHSTPRGVRGDGGTLGHVPVGQGATVERESGEGERKGGASWGPWGEQNPAG